MRNVIVCILCAMVFFALGYLYSSRTILFTEFSETNSNVISRTFLERSYLYTMVKKDDPEKVSGLLESLIYGDLVAMDMVDFSKRENAELFCTQLQRLSKVADENISFFNELEVLLKKCS